MADTQQTNLDDYHWLVSPDACQWLNTAAGDHASLVALTQSLRAEIGPKRSHLVVAQVELRRRAKDKFTRAEAMFFTRQLLEQSTDDQISEYKADRFPADQEIADLCCGIGGDLLGLAGRGQVTGVDRDPIALIFAEANCRAWERAGAGFEAADVNQFDVTRYQAWHLDPDRRAAEQATGTGRVARRRRTTKVEYQEPAVDSVNQLLESNPRAAIKLAPATKTPESWAERAELEWIGSRGECRQQVAWFEDLARFPGQRSATAFVSGCLAPLTVHGTPNEEIPQSSAVGRFVFEPHAAVLAAGLSCVLATQHTLSEVSEGIAYLTGDKVVDDPILSCFEVTEVLPFDPKHLKKAIRERNIGNLEIKKRGVRVSPEQVRKEIRPKGDESATLLLLPVHGKVRAILAQRVGVSEQHSEARNSAGCPHAVSAIVYHRWQGAQD